MPNLVTLHVRLIFKAVIRLGMPENTHHEGKYHRTTEFQFDWFGLSCFSTNIEEAAIAQWVLSAPTILLTQVRIPSAASTIWLNLNCDENMANKKLAYITKHIFLLGQIQTSKTGGQTYSNPSHKVIWQVLSLQSESKSV